MPPRPRRPKTSPKPVAVPGAATLLAKAVPAKPAATAPVPIPPASGASVPRGPAPAAPARIAPGHALLAFDRPWYEAQNPDVLEAGIDPATHYFIYGYRELRAPNPHFNPRAYRNANPDLATFEGDLFLHYIFYGATEGRPLR